MHFYLFFLCITLLGNDFFNSLQPLVFVKLLIIFIQLDDDGDILRSLRVVTSDTIALGFTELTITTSLLERTQLGASRNNTVRNDMHVIKENQLSRSFSRFLLSSVYSNEKDCN